MVITYSSPDYFFSILSDGTRIFRPGRLFAMKGLVIPTPETQTSLEIAVRNYKLFELVAVLLMGAIVAELAPKLTFLGMLLLILGMFFVARMMTYAYFRRHTKGLVAIPLARSLIDNWRQLGDFLTLGRLWGVVIGCCIFVLLGVFAYATAGDPKLLLFSTFCGAMLIPFSVALWHRYRVD